VDFGGNLPANHVRLTGVINRANHQSASNVEEGTHGDQAISANASHPKIKTEPTPLEGRLVNVGLEAYNLWAGAGDALVEDIVQEETGSGGQVPPLSQPLFWGPNNDYISGTMPIGTVGSPTDHDTNDLDVGGRFVVWYPRPAADPGAPAAQTHGASRIAVGNPTTPGQAHSHWIEMPDMSVRDTRAIRGFFTVYAREV